MSERLRRYWQPIAALAELDAIRRLPGTTGRRHRRSGNPV
jgi:hypothetical protein